MASSRTLRKGGMAYAEPDMDYAMDEDDDEDDLSDLLDEDPDDEDEQLPPDDDQDSALQLAAEVDNLYKQLDGRDDMILQLAKATRTLAKRVMALEGSGDDRRVEKDENAAESDFTVASGQDDLGEPEAYNENELESPGLTAGEPQGVAENKALSIAKALRKSGVPMNV